MGRKKKKKLDDAFLATHAASEFNASVTWRDSTGVVERWVKDNDLYDARFSTDSKEKSDVLVGQGKLFIPKTYAHVQRMLVDILDTFFFDPEEIVDIGSWKSIPSETREITKALLNYRLNGHPINFYQEAYEACLDALKNKVGIFKVYPQLAIEEVGGEKVVKGFVPRLECIPYEDVFFSRDATWKDYYRYTIIHRMVKSIDYLKRRGYKNLDLLEPINGSDDGTDEIKLQRTNGYGSSPFSNTVEVENSQSVFVYEIWTHLDVNGDGFLESCSYLMGGTAQGPAVVLRDVEENTLPYIHEGDEYNRPPIIVGQAFPESHQMYGKSIPEIVEGLQRETNALRNQRREAVALALRKPILASRHANIDLMSLVNRRVGGVVLGDDISQNAVRELQVSDPTAASIQEQIRTDQDFYETTSIPPNLLGIPASRDETATGVTAQISNANRKIFMAIKNLAQTLFVPAFRMLLRLEQAYESDDFIRLVTGRSLGWTLADDEMPPRSIIQGDFDLKINLGMNKQTQLNKYMMLMDRANAANQSTAAMVSAGVVRPEDARFIDVMSIFKKIFPLFGEKNVDEFMIQSQRPQAPVVPLKGVASQPRLSRNIDAETAYMNPEGSAINGIV